MQIKLWGVRGSIPTPTPDVEYREKLVAVLQSAIRQGLSSEQEIAGFVESLPPYLSHVYGGDTTCLSVETRRNSLPVVVDCGTGLRALGDELMAGPAGRGEGELHVLLTHTHLDHINGLPFFKPLYIPGNIVHFYSPFDNLETRLVRQQIEPFFPMPFQQMAANKFFHRITEQEPLELEDGTVVDCYPLKHPGGSFAYRFRQNSHSFVFATDVEFTGTDLEHMDRNHAFFGGADLLVMDAQYTLDDHFSRFDWGHTSLTMAVNCGVRWQVKNLVLTHHEPAYTDERLYRNYLSAIEHREAMSSALPRLYLARQGMQFQVGSHD